MQEGAPRWACAALTQQPPAAFSPEVVFPSVAARSPFSDLSLCVSFRLLRTSHIREALRPVTSDHFVRLLTVVVTMLLLGLVLDESRRVALP